MIIILLLVMLAVGMGGLPFWVYVSLYDESGRDD